MRLEDVRARHTQNDRAAPMEGRISRGPGSDDDTVLVTLDAYGHRRQDEAFGWAPRGTTDPAPGDTVWVQRADSGRLIVVAWHPA